MYTCRGCVGVRQIPTWKFDIQMQTAYDEIAMREKSSPKERKGYNEREILKKIQDSLKERDSLRESVYKISTWTFGLRRAVSWLKLSIAVLNLD